MKELGFELGSQGWTLNTLLRSWYCKPWDPIEDCWGRGRLCSVQYRFSEMVGIGRGMGRMEESGVQWFRQI